jgi:hypothetical protein
LDDLAKQKALEDFRQNMSESPSSPEWILEELERSVGELFGTACSGFDRATCSMSFSDRGGANDDGSSVSVVSGGIRGRVWRWAVAEGLTTAAETVLTMVDHPCLGVIERRKAEVEVDYPTILHELQRRLMTTPVEPTVCRVATIYEPCKVRIITEGQWDVYAAGKPLQKSLWKRLQRHDCFILTGTPQSESLINQFVNSAAVQTVLPKFDPSWGWKSADFKDATNLMHFDACSVAVRVSTSAVYDWLGERLCGSHRIFFPKESGLAPVDQRRGQLMGSPISFPLLCAVNMACLRWAFEKRFDRIFSVDDLPILINGDDNVFPADERLLRLWEQAIGAVGFKESPGKSYFSRDWLQINSRTYDITVYSTPRCDVRVARERAYVNFGIIGGLKKGVKRQDAADLEELAKRTRDQWDHVGGLKGLVWGRTAVLYVRNYLHFARQAKKKGYLPFELWPWNPVEVGGLGWPGPVSLRAAGEACNWRKLRVRVSHYLSGERPDSVWEQIADVSPKMTRARLARVLLRASWFRQLRNSGAHLSDGGRWICPSTPSMDETWSAWADLERVSLLT